MRTKTYVFEDIKKGMELIKEKYGPDALIVDIKSSGNNGNSRCEISVLVQEEVAENFASCESLRRKIEEVWDSVQTVVSERFVEIERYLYLKRIESYPLSLRTVFDKMRKNGTDLKLAFDIVSQAFLEAGDIVDSMTKAYYFVKNVIKKKIKMYALRKDTSPVILFGPEDSGKSLMSKKIAHFLRNSGLFVSIASFSGSDRKTWEDLSHFGENGTTGLFVAEKEEELLEKVLATAGRKIIVDFGGNKIEDFVSKLSCSSERLLVLSAGSRDEKIEAYCERYRNLISGVIFTRIDEEVCSGHILEHLVKLHIPVCLFGTGKGIKDMVIPEDERFFKILIEGNIWMGKEKRQFL